MNVKTHSDRVTDGLAEGISEPVRVRQHQEGGREAVVGRQSAVVRVWNDAGKFECLGKKIAFYLLNINNSLSEPTF